LVHKTIYSKILRRVLSLEGVVKEKRIDLQEVISRIVRKRDKMTNM